jgi:hypothetical protein
MTVPGKIRMSAGLLRIRGWWSGDPERERLILLIRRHQIGMRKAAQALMELDRLDGKTSGGKTDDEFE